jgi:NAD(P)-dependent dehydrogenase (short-subunit alcohol dehydrogenase family)
VHGLDVAYELNDPSYRAVTGDVTDEADLRAVLDAAVREHGRLDGLVNCAGISLPPDRSYESDTFLRTFSVNTLARWHRSDSVGWRHG